MFSSFQPGHAVERGADQSSSLPYVGQHANSPDTNDLCPSLFRHKRGKNNLWCAGKTARVNFGHDSILKSDTYGSKPHKFHIY